MTASLGQATDPTISPPSGEIDQPAKGEASDLIVMAAHGRTGLGRALMGSVADEVMRTAHGPVLTVKAPSPATSIASSANDQKPAEMAGTE
jgi:hypothetical protein